MSESSIILQMIWTALNAICTFNCPEESHLFLTNAKRVCNNKHMYLQYALTGSHYVMRQTPGLVKSGDL